MLKFLLSAAFAVTLVIGPVHSATKSEEDACEPDVKRLCRKVMAQGDFVVLACLKERRIRISRACDKVLKRHGQ